MAVSRTGAGISGTRTVYLKSGIRSKIFSKIGENFLWYPNSLLDLFTNDVVFVGPIANESSWSIKVSLCVIAPEEQNNTHTGNPHNTTKNDPPQMIREHLFAII